MAANTLDSDGYFCNHRPAGEPDGGLICDLVPGHTGRHRERWVASWNEEGTDVRPKSLARNEVAPESAQ